VCFFLGKAPMPSVFKKQASHHDGAQLGFYAMPIAASSDRLSELGENATKYACTTIAIIADAPQNMVFRAFTWTGCPKRTFSQIWSQPLHQACGLLQ